MVIGLCVVQFRENNYAVEASEVIVIKEEGWCTVVHRVLTLPLSLLVFLSAQDGFSFSGYGTLVLLASH